jgi:hypothetical protein
VVEDRKPKAKPKYCEVNQTLRHDQDLVDIRNRTNFNIYPYLPIFETPLFNGNHDQNSYASFYRTLLSIERFTSDDELEENSERLVQSYATYTNSKGRCLEQVTESGIDKISTNYVPWTTWKPNSDANYTIKVLHNTSIIHIIGTVGFTTVEYFGETAVTTTENGKYKWLYGKPVVHEHTSNYNIVHVVYGKRTLRGNAPVTARERRLRNFNRGPIAT